jgi:hypothetical protein
MENFWISVEDSTPPARFDGKWYSNEVDKTASAWLLIKDQCGIKGMAFYDLEDCCFYNTECVEVQNVTHYAIIPD